MRRHNSQIIGSFVGAFWLERLVKNECSRPIILREGECSSCTLPDCCVCEITLKPQKQKGSGRSFFFFLLTDLGGVGLLPFTSLSARCSSSFLTSIIAACPAARYYLRSSCTTPEEASQSPHATGDCEPWRRSSLWRKRVDRHLNSCLNESQLLHRRCASTGIEGTVPNISSEQRVSKLQ